MKIECSKTFVLNETVWRENELVPSDELDEMATSFIQYYKDWNLDRLAFDQRGQEISVTLALCVLEEKESWKDVAKKIAEDDWSGASLALWKLYAQDRRDAIQEIVMLPGTLYRDDDFVEWVPVVRHRPVISIIGILRGSETKISMKRSIEIGLAKTRTMLISKTEVLKT